MILFGSMQRLLLGCLVCAPAGAQLGDLATSWDGRTLLLRSAFRLQTGTDVKFQGKLYQ